MLSVMVVMYFILVTSLKFDLCRAMLHTLCTLDVALCVKYTVYFRLIFHVCYARDMICMCLVSCRAIQTLCSKGDVVLYVNCTVVSDMFSCE